MTEKENGPLRPLVSLSQALHCRMEIWLNSQGQTPEPHKPGTLRTFDVGNMVEAAFFDGTGTGAGRPWFFDAEEIKDPAGGYSIKTDLWTIEGRQREVTLFGYKGHVDALLVNVNGSGTILVDLKTSSGFGYDRAMTGNLMDSPFSREYVGQLHAYRAGLELQKQAVDLMALIYFNKEQSKLMMRIIDHDKDITSEAIERLSWAQSKAAPKPDWEWKPGEKIPLRCGYCAQKLNCAKARGSTLRAFSKKNEPVWTAGA